MYTQTNNITVDLLIESNFKFNLEFSIEYFKKGGLLIEALSREWGGN